MSFGNIRCEPHYFFESRACGREISLLQQANTLLGDRIHCTLLRRLLGVSGQVTCREQQKRDRDGSNSRGCHNQRKFPRLNIG